MDLVEQFGQKVPVFDSTPEGLKDQIKRSMHFLEAEYQRGHNSSRLVSINLAYSILWEQLSRLEQKPNV